MPHIPLQISDDYETQSGSSFMADSDTASMYLLNSLLNRYFCYSLPTIAEEDVEMDGSDVLGCEEIEDVELFWRGVIETRRGREGRESPMGVVIDDNVGELEALQSISNRNHLAEENLVSYFSSSSSIDDCLEEEEGVEEENESFSMTNSDSHRPMPSLAPKKSISSFHSKFFLKPPTSPTKKSRLLLPLTKLPKRLSESLSSFSLPSPLRRKNSTKSPPLNPITTSYRVPDPPPYTQAYDDSWTNSAPSTPSFRTSAFSSPLSSPVSSPLSSPTSSSFFSRSLTTFPTSESLKENLNFGGSSGFRDSFIRRRPEPSLEDDERSWGPEMDDMKTTAPLRIVKRTRVRTMSN